MDQQEDIEIKAIAKGLVQGVGFRASVRTHAKHLEILGTVRNLKNGAVEIVLKGKKSVIENFLKAIKENKIAGNVSDLSFEEVSPQNSYDTFQIL